MARAASELDISTKPKPRGRPVSRSVMRETFSTVPCVANKARTLSSVALNGRLPTYSLVTAAILTKKRKRKWTPAGNPCLASRSVIGRMKASPHTSTFRAHWMVRQTLRGCKTLAVRGCAGTTLCGSDARRPRADKPKENEPGGRVPQTAPGCRTFGLDCAPHAELYRRHDSPRHPGAVLGRHLRP